MTSAIQPVSPATFTTDMEQLQTGYLYAVAATAGCTVNEVKRDTFAKDALITRPNGPGVEETSLYVQLKSTTTLKPDRAKPHFGYQFKKRQYMEDLAVPDRTIKVILVVMAVHPHQAAWAAASHDELTLQHCCYWKSLEGETVPAGVESPSTKISTTNIFDAKALAGILDKIERGQPL